MTEHDYGDPISEPYWAAAARHELVVQRCVACGRFQLYGRPFCLACQSDDVEWVPASGLGTVYSQVTVCRPVRDELEPPYLVAVVELDEGPRLLTNIAGPPTEIGARVRVGWRDRDGLPPVPVFERLEHDGDA